MIEKKEERTNHVLYAPYYFIHEQTTVTITSYTVIFFGDRVRKILSNASENTLRFYLSHIGHVVSIYLLHLLVDFIKYEEKTDPVRRTSYNYFEICMNVK